MDPDPTTLTKKQFTTLLKKFSDAYYLTDTPLVSDIVFDELVSIYESKFGKYTIIGAEPKGIKVPLPYYLSSLDKIKTEKEINKWKKAHPGPYVIEDKVDGLTLLYDNGRLLTHGNGLVGSDVTALNLDLPITNLPIRGEGVVTEEDFAQIADLYTNARSAASGIINGVKTELAHFITFVAFRIVSSDDSPSEQMVTLDELGFNTPRPILSEDINLEFLTDYYNDRVAEADYAMDGLVVMQNTTINYPKSANPKQAIAFKTENETAQVEVIDVVWNVSMLGKLKPMIKIKPVFLTGVTITSISGHNGRFIIDNNIGIGAEIEITRSGGVIPKFIKTISPAKPTLPDSQYSWDINHVEFIVSNQNSDIIAKQLHHFFKTIEFQGIGPAVCKTLVTAGLTSVPQIINELGNHHFGAHVTSLLKTLPAYLQTVAPATLADASSIFPAIGTRKFEIVVDNLGPYWYTIPDLEDQLRNLKGFDKTVDVIMAHVDEYAIWLNELGLNTFEENVATGDLNNEVVVFTGFRDKTLKDEIIQNGGKVADSITSKTTILLVLDVNNLTVKMQKALDKGVKIMTADQFRDKYEI